MSIEKIKFMEAWGLGIIVPSDTTSGDYKMPIKGDFMYISVSKFWEEGKRMMGIYEEFTDIIIMIADLWNVREDLCSDNETTNHAFRFAKLYGIDSIRFAVPRKYYEPRI